MPHTGIILAGGKSSRMGSDKSLISFQNENLMNRLVREMRTAVDEIIIVSNQKDKFHIKGAREISDIYPNMGPMGGIHAGLTAASNYYCFITACDMPFFKGKLASTLLSKCAGFDVTVPRINEHLEPLCAVYSRKCIQYTEECLKNNIRTVYDFYPRAKVNYLNESITEGIQDGNNIFFNLNTPIDLEHLKRMREEL